MGNENPSPKTGINDQQLSIFSKVGDRVDIDLHIKDIIESNVEEAGLKVKYPVCFECFDRILVKMGDKI